MNTKTMKIIMMLLGNLLMGIAVAILRMSRFGTDPFTCMNLGVSGFLNISFGTYQLLVNIIFFIFVLWKGRSCIGAGTIVNMIYRRFWSVCFDKMSRAARDAVYADQDSIDDLCSHYVFLCSSDVYGSRYGNCTI